MTRCFPLGGFVSTGQFFITLFRINALTEFYRGANSRCIGDRGGGIFNIRKTKISRSRGMAPPERQGGHRTHYEKSPVIISRVN